MDHLNGFESYLSPYSWRYGSVEMRRIWSEVHKRLVWRRIWLALAETQFEFGLVRLDQLEDLQAHVGEVNIERSLEIEAEIHHDLMAELKTFAEQCLIGGGILHLGATSADVEDNADAIRMTEAFEVILFKLKDLLTILADQMDRWAELPIIAFTHLQPAEPSTLGYRLAQYGQDLLTDWDHLQQVCQQIKGKGFKGAVGTGASYAELIGLESLEDFEKRLSEKLALPFFSVTTQVYPRKQDYWVVSALAGLAGTLYKFAFDLRILQTPAIGEMSEPFGRSQVGSSAMPFKQNPINAEKIDSLARYLAQLPRLAWDNAAHSLLERTLDDSANRRTLLPEAFLISDELLKVMAQIVKGLQVDETTIARNLEIFNPFAATERVLLTLVKAGANRQQIHERLRVHSMAAWQAIRQGKSNPLAELICHDPELLIYSNEGQIKSLFNARNYIGDAPHRTRTFSIRIRFALKATNI